MAADLRILLIGNGGREHALAWKLSQSTRVQAILAVPGNGGTARCPKVTNLSSVAADDFAGLVRLAQEHDVGLVVPGPEAPLVAGIEAYFRRAGIPCFGPSPEAARLEGSKTYSKRFMSKYGIPTAAYANFDDYRQAVDYLDRLDDGPGAEVVIKATGLAAGKGVVMPGSRAEAKEALRRIMVEGEFGPAGDEVVIEQRLQGDELSLLTFCDGYSTRSLPLSQDHKRIGDGDEGPNTGGMGCYAPTSLATPDLLRTIEQQIVEPTVAGMRKEKQPFRGLLFTGLMLTSDGPKVLEYNVRFGDPETQTVLPLLSADTDLADIMLACTGGYLDNCHLQVDDKFSATVVVAAPGYPGPYPKGLPISLGPEPPSTTLFHAGTLLHQDQLQTSGGRVLAVNAVGPSLRAAVDTVYAALARDLVRFDGIFFRRDIAHRAFRSSASSSTSMTYAQAGVDIEAGNAFVDKIRRAVASTRRPGADALIGGFGGELDLAACGYPGAPILVAAIDGVGTKLMIAQAMRKHHAVGIDLVAMNVNDLIVQGARPLLFLDYYGCSRLHLASAAAFVDGVADGCRQAGCALVGGETAEMPGMYRDDDYDVAGCAVGAVAAPDRLPRLQSIAQGDLLLGLASSGLHSNGFSLARRILDAAHLDYAAPAPWDPSQTVGDALLTPTRIYVAALLPVLARIKALAHITGGGLIENPPRVLPPGLSAEIDFGSWPLPPVFHWLREAGNVAPLEMCRTFNMGIGMIIVVGPAEAEAVTEMLQATENVYRIGQLVPREQDQPPCLIRHLDF